MRTAIFIGLVFIAQALEENNGPNVTRVRVALFFCFLLQDMTALMQGRV